MQNKFKHPEPIAKEFEGVSAKIEQARSDIKKAAVDAANKGVKRDDTIDLSKMNADTLYMKKVDGKVALKVKIDGKEVTLFQEA